MMLYWVRPVAALADAAVVVVDTGADLDFAYDRDVDLQGVVAVPPAADIVAVVVVQAVDTVAVVAVPAAGTVAVGVVVLAADTVAAAAAEAEDGSAVRADDSLMRETEFLMLLMGVGEVILDRAFRQADCSRLRLAEAAEVAKAYGFETRSMLGEDLAEGHIADAAERVEADHNLYWSEEEVQPEGYMEPESAVVMVVAAAGRGVGAHIEVAGLAGEVLEEEHIAVAAGSDHDHSGLEVEGEEGALAGIGFEEEALAGIDFVPDSHSPAVVVVAEAAAADSTALPGYMSSSDYIPHHTAAVVVEAAAADRKLLVVLLTLLSEVVEGVQHRRQQYHQRTFSAAAQTHRDP